MAAEANDEFKKKKSIQEKTAFTLVLLMTLLQGFYGIFAYVDPLSFSVVRGTELFSAMDADWTRIYGSRTIYITLSLAYLLYTRHYRALMWCALFGSVMPISDALLAFEAQAPFKVVLKHLVTIVYLIATFAALRSVAKKPDDK